MVAALVSGASIVFQAPAFAQAPVTYRVSFPEAQHHRMQVEVAFADVPAGTLEVVMSRTSPGRYAVHEFAKNVYDVQIDNGAEEALEVVRPNPWQWNVAGHSGTVRVRYKVFGDRADGTFLDVDLEHAHMNMPASLMWARGLEQRPVRISFDAPAGWRIATQLHPTSDARTFTAANLQYLIDSPTELSAFTMRTFNLGHEFRVAVHHDGSEADVDRFVADVEKIVREQRTVFGEFPSFEAPYTFIADYLPSAAEDGMEHRNSTILTGPYRLRVPEERMAALGTVSHEFFHSWNVERIRPASLEPFKLDQPNPSEDLWFAEGFTSYYGPLTLRRTGLWNVEDYASHLSRLLEEVSQSPATTYLSAQDASRLAQYVDQAAWIDPTNFANHHLSYYDWGAVIGLVLDLQLRTRSQHRVTLDHYMRRLWEEFGRLKAEAEGTVARPYTNADLRRVLAEISGDRMFADDFFNRFVEGRNGVPEYISLLSRAGFATVERHPDRAWIGPIALDFSGGAARVSQPTLENTPVYRAGIDLGDELLSLEGATVTGPSRLYEVIARRRPGDRVRASVRRGAAVREITIELERDRSLMVVPVERTGRSLTNEERAFRAAWLGSKQ